MEERDTPYRFGVFCSRCLQITVRQLLANMEQGWAVTCWFQPVITVICSMFQGYSTRCSMSFIVSDCLLSLLGTFPLLYKRGVSLLFEPLPFFRLFVPGALIRF